MASKDMQAYNLIMEMDSNSCGATQWFYFSVSNTKAKRQYNFRILNFKKSSSQFQHGMKVFAFSEIGSRRSENDKDWKREGHNIKYHPTDCQNRLDVIMQEKCEGKHTLEFSYTSEFNGDMLYFAYSIPYTSIDLLKDTKLWKKKANGIKKLHFSKQLMCYSLLGCEVNYYVIHKKTDKENKPVRKMEGQNFIVISSRVHPGESLASYKLILRYFNIKLNKNI